MVITAKRKNGTPAEKGDDVLVVWKNGFKIFGRTLSVEGPRLFKSGAEKYARLQTYNIRCKDGVTRPAHALHIKYINPRKSYRRTKCTR